MNTHEEMSANKADNPVAEAKAKETADESKEQKATVTPVSLVDQLVPVVTEKMATAGVALSPSTVMQVLRLAMEAVEGAPIKGEEQKQLAIDIILQIATAANLPDEHMFLIKNLVDGGIVGDTIELIVDATRGNLDINKAKAVASGCFMRLFRAFCRKTTEEEKQKKAELKAEREKQKKLEYKAMVKTINEREAERKERNKEERRKVAKIIREREEKKQQKKDEKQQKKEAKQKAKEEKRNAKKKRPALNIPADTPTNQSASLRVPSELSFPALSSNLPDSVVNVADEDKKNNQPGTEV